MFYFVTMKVLKVATILFLALTTMNCIVNKDKNIDQKTVVMTEKGYTQGVIIDKTGLDGCTFLIQVNDSIVFHPINLDPKFSIAGLKVYFKYKKSRKATICMNGQPILLQEIIKQ